MRKLWNVNIRPHITVSLVIFLFVMFVFSVLSIRSERADHRQDVAFAQIQTNQEAIQTLAEARQRSIENRAIKDYGICKQNKASIDAIATLLRVALSNAAKAPTTRTPEQQKQLHQFQGLLATIRPVDCGPEPLDAS